MSPDDTLPSPAMLPGSAESSKRLSMRKNLKGKKKESPWANAANWVRRRREAVKKAVNASNPQARAPKKMKLAKLAASLRTQGHEKEKQFNLSKERKRRILVTLATFSNYRFYDDPSLPKGNIQKKPLENLGFIV